MNTDWNSPQGDFDTAEKQGELLMLLSGQQVTVHTSAEDDFDYTPFEGSARTKAICFSTGKRGIITTGGSSGYYYDDTWVIHPYEWEEDEKVKQQTAHCSRNINSCHLPGVFRSSHLRHALFDRNNRSKRRIRLSNIPQQPYNHIPAFYSRHFGKKAFHGKRGCQKGREISHETYENRRKPYCYPS